MLMRLQPYDLTIKYRQGKNMEVADALSRLSPEEKDAIPNTKEYGFKHITSSPHYLRSNGFIESKVKTIKMTMKKAKATNTDPLMALLCLRATPIDNKLPSPAELLLGRPIQDNLPRKTPTSIANEETEPLPALNSGQKISIQDPATQRWEPAEIKEKIQGVPRSYVVTKEGGREVRRNRIQIREISQEPKQPMQDQKPQHANQISEIRSNIESRTCNSHRQP